jgi:hypothetical protein
LCFLSFLLLFVSSWLFRLNLLFPFDYRSTLMVRLFHLHFLLCDLVGLLLSGSFELFMLSLLVQCMCLIKCLRDDSFFFLNFHGGRNSHLDLYTVAYKALQPICKMGSREPEL